MKHIKCIIALLFIAVLISGCGGDKITGHATIDLAKNVIKNAEKTTVKISGKNTGNVAANVILKVIPEDPSKLIITYPGNLEFVLQPNEDTGTKLINVQGFTDYSSTRYSIHVQLVNKANNEVLDQKMEWLTVNK